MHGDAPAPQCRVQPRPRSHPLSVRRQNDLQGHRSRSFPAEVEVVSTVKRCESIMSCLVRGRNGATASVAFDGFDSIRLAVLFNDPFLQAFQIRPCSWKLAVKLKPGHLASEEVNP